MPNANPSPLLPLRAIAVVAAATLLLGGCNWFSRNKNQTEYQRATQSRPLEVPPDLDSPAGSAALTIPETRRGTVEGGTLVLGRPESAAATAPSGAPPAVSASSSRINGQSLQISDTPESAWRRIGLSLGNISGAAIQSRNEAHLSYAITSSIESTQRAGWFKRAITLGKASKKVRSDVPLQVNVSGEGESSIVTITGDGSDAAATAIRNVLDRLDERLN